MPYNKTHNWLFIHIPKNAGGSITNILLENPSGNRPIRPRADKLKMFSLALARNATQRIGKGDLSTLNGAYPYTFSLEHLTYREIELLQLIPSDTLESAFKFCVVRNPWQRAVSSFYSHARHENYTSFEEFCLHWFDDSSRSHDELAHRRTQYDYIQNLAGDPAMDFILRYESLDKDFAELRHRLGLPVMSLPHTHKGSGTSREDYRLLYTSRAKRKISRLFECDIDYFKYTF